MEGLTLFRAILTVVAVLFLAYHCSRLLGKRGMHASVQRNLKVIEQLPVGQGRILLIKVSGHAYLIGVSHAGIQLLTELEKDMELEGPLQPEDSGMGKKTALQKDLERFAGDMLDRTGEFLKKKAGRFKEASKEQSFQEILQKSTAVHGSEVSSAGSKRLPVLTDQSIQPVPASPEDTGPQPIEGGEKDG